jgi:hypothetical protein
MHFYIEGLALTRFQNYRMGSFKGDKLISHKYLSINEKIVLYQFGINAVTKNAQETRKIG